MIGDQSEHPPIISNASPRGYKTFFILNSTEHEVYPAHKC